MIAKERKDETVFRTQEGNLIPISKLTDEDLIEAAQFCKKRSDDCFNMKKGLNKRAEQLEKKSEFFAEMLSNLEDEIQLRKKVVESKLKVLSIDIP